MTEIAEAEVVRSADAFSFTDAAAKRIQFLIQEENKADLMLRVYITGGGCSGFQYGFAFDQVLRPDDVVVAKTIEGTTVKVVIDALSVMYLAGAQIEYIESLQGAHFTVKNPNAQTTCSCGSSFSL